MKHLSHIIIRFCQCLIFVLFSVHTIYAQTWNQVIQSQNGGYSVSVYGDYAIVGDKQEAEDADGLNPVLGAGSAYILFNNSGNWTQIKKIIAPVRSVDDNFGISVSISGDYVVVGAPLDDKNNLDTSPLDGAGSAYIFRKDKGGINNWGFVKKITAFSRGQGDNFGYSVSISGNNILVGAPYEDHDEAESNALYDPGSAYLFSVDPVDPDNWIALKKITAPSRSNGARFGDAVSIDGGNVFIGATSDYFYDSETSANYVGAVYIFVKDIPESGNWGYLKRLHGSSTAPNGEVFGYSVCVKGQQAIVGTKMEAFGSAYIFGKEEGGGDSWGLVKKITSTNTDEADFFGSSVSISGNNAIIGAQNTSYDIVPVSRFITDKHYIQWAGAAYIYKRDKGGTNNWGLVKKIRAEEPSLGGYFGCAVAITDSWAFVGSFNNYNNTRPKPLSEYGAVFIFKEVPCNAVADMVIPTSEGIFQSVNTVQEQGLTYFCDCANNYLLLALDTKGSRSVIFDNGVKMKVGVGATYYPKGTGFVTSGDGAVFFNRRWTVNAWSQPGIGLTVRVRSYYTTADFNAVNATLTTNGRPTFSSENQMTFYKVTLNSLGEFPEIAQVSKNNVVVINNGATAGIGTWIGGTNGVNKFAEFKVSSFSGGGGGASTEPLPVNLTDLNAKQIENQIKLLWNTSFESNSNNFEVQKSTDAKFWEILGSVPASKESTQLRSYAYTDINPLIGENFYRLKMIDLDGSFAYSRIVGLKFDSKGTFTTYPNPVSDKIYFKSTELDKIESIRILNSSGSTVSKNLPVTKDGISISYLTSGIYFIEIKRKDGTKYSEKTMVVR